MTTSWPRKTLGEVCQVRGGGTPSKAVERYWRGDIPWVSPKDMKFDVVSDSIDHISREAIVGSATSLIPKDSVLMVVRSGILARTVPIAITGRDLTINQDLKALCPNRGVDARFLYHQLDSKMDVLLSMVSRGATVHRLVTDQIRALDFFLPPFPEQQRIVGILDEAFEGIATATANAEKNLHNARALFESHLQSVFTVRGKGWVEKSVREIAAPAKGSIRTGPFGSQLLHSEFVDEGIAVLGIDNAVANEFRWGKNRFITPEKYRQLERYTVHPGDVLITIMGTCGRCAIVPDDIPTAINTKHICCITLDRKICLPGYLHIYFLNSPQSQGFLVRHAKGAIMAGLNMGLIQELPVMLPPIAVQAEIVKAANALHEETQRLESIYQQKLAALDELKKSLLHRAFNGELIKDNGQ